MTEKRNRADYMRDYRAKQATTKANMKIAEVNPPEPKLTVDNQGQLARDRVPGSKLANPYTDGLPDWPELIQNLTQHQRDEILEKINRSGTKNR